MRFTILRLPSWYFFPAMVIGDWLSDWIFQLVNRSWWIFIGFTVVWIIVVGFGGIWIWNLVRPLYLTIGTSGLSIGKMYYDRKEIESISISKGKRRTISLYFKRERFPLQIIPKKIERERMSPAVEQWAHEHRIPTSD